MNTLPIAAFPGFQWVEQQRKEDGWRLTWRPIPNVYSPPSLWPLIRKVGMTVQDPSIMGRVMGKNGCYFKDITARSRAMYIFFHNGVIECWGVGISADIALDMVQHRIRTLPRTIVVPVPDKKIIGRVIGMGGDHLKRIAHSTGVTSIMYNGQHIVIKGNGSTVDNAQSLLIDHMARCAQRARKH